MGSYQALVALSNFKESWFYNFDITMMAPELHLCFQINHFDFDFIGFLQLVVVIGTTPRRPARLHQESH